MTDGLRGEGSDPLDCLEGNDTDVTENRNFDTQNSN